MPHAADHGWAAGSGGGVGRAASDPKDSTGCRPGAIEAREDPWGLRFHTSGRGEQRHRRQKSLDVLPAHSAIRGSGRIQSGAVEPAGGHRGIGGKPEGSGPFGDLPNPATAAARTLRGDGEKRQDDRHQEGRVAERCVGCHPGNVPLHRAARPDGSTRGQTAPRPFRNRRGIAAMAWLSNVEAAFRNTLCGSRSRPANIPLDSYRNRFLQSDPRTAGRCGGLRFVDAPKNSGGNVMPAA